MALTASLVEDTWNGHNNFPDEGGKQTRLYRRTSGADLTMDEFLTLAEGYSVGDEPFDPADPRAGWVIDVALRQENQRIIRETVTISNEVREISWGSTNTQSTNPRQPGYCNVDIRHTTTSATWWRYGTPAELSAGDIPWVTAKPSTNSHCELVQLEDLAVDVGGAPLTYPLPQEEVTINLSWESNAAVAAYRSTWRSLRNTRNNASIFGFDIGTLLFAGVGQRVATSAEMPITDLRFIFDPFGFCRQSVLSGPGGKFDPYYLFGTTVPPSGGTCGGETFTGSVKHAKWPYWVQLFPSLTDFSSLFTSQQLTTVSSLL